MESFKSSKLFSLFWFFNSFIVFNPDFLDNNIIHRSPVQSNNLEVKFLIKFLLRFSLKEISMLLCLKLIKLTLFSNSYFNSISFFVIQIDIKSEKELIFVLFINFLSSKETFCFSCEENLIWFIV